MPGQVTWRVENARDKTIRGAIKIHETQTKLKVVGSEIEWKGVAYESMFIFCTFKLPLSACIFACFIKDSL